ncbi:hypothetical protein J4210_00800 [Candidatus Woesearchaeota archaeon]|nr:hypothetical protein [Candidatus Woesearchaeota archaeon]
MVYITQNRKPAVRALAFADSTETKEALDQLILELETPVGIIAERGSDGSIEVRPLGGTLEIYCDGAPLRFNRDGYQTFEGDDEVIRIYSG